MNSSGSFDLLNLLPKFSLINDGNLSSPDGLAAIFVSVLIGLTLIAAILCLNKYRQARKHLVFYRNLIDKVTPEGLLVSRRDLVLTALKSKSYGQLWKEFDESLVLNKSSERLFNTLDAAHFFNTHNLARGLTENRLLAATPGFLTAFGVIGTFAGLQLGLAPLGNMPAGATVVDMTSGIYSMIGGASIAFITSVWGVATSVLFNFFEKILERSIRSQIATFQNQVDYLYPRITAEQSLVNIEDINSRSSETLAELDEKIGHKMQEAMQQVSSVINEGLQESLNQILGPAVQQLVTNAHTGSEKALESMLERFLAGIGNAGENQKSMFEQVAHDISTASLGMSDKLGQFADNLELKMSDLSTKNSEMIARLDENLTNRISDQQQQDSIRQSTLSAEVSNLVGQMTTTIETLSEQNSETILQSQTAVSEHISRVHHLEAERHDQLNQKIGDLIGNINQSINDNTTSNLSVLDSVQASMSKQLDQQGERLSKQHQDLSLYVNGLVENVNKNIEESTTSNLSVIDSVQQSFSHQLDQQDERLGVQHKNLSKLVEAQNLQQENLMQSVANLLSNQRKDSQITQSGLVQLLEKFNMVSDSQKIVNEQLKSTSTELKGATTQLGILSLNLKTAAESLGDQVTSAINGITSVSKQTEDQIIQLDGLVEHTDRINNGVSELVAGLSAASDKAEISFTAVGQHFENLMTSLRKHVEGLESNIADLLNGYGEQVERQTTDRMKTWNDQTRDYTSSMTDAINTLNSVVDEMDSKLSVKQGSYA